MRNFGRQIVWVLLASLAMAGVSMPAAAGELEDLQERMKARYAELLALKKEEKIGETWQGYVAAVKTEFQEDKKIAKLLADENADRKRVYEIIAERQGTSVEKVAERNAQRNFEKAKSGEWLKHEKEGWKKKE